MFRKVAPSVEIGEKLELEQSKLIWEGCSKQEEQFKTGVGAKQADLGRLLQAGRTVQGGSRSKAS